MNMFMEFFLFFVSILQFLFPFAFKDTEVPVQTTEPVVEETVVPGEHVHSGGNGNCLQSAICEICGETYGGDGDHVFTATVKPATCTQGGYTTFRCRFCLYTEQGDYTEATGHSYTKKTTTATCVAAAYNIYTCESCSASYNELIEPAKGHDYESETFSANCTEGFRTVYKCKTCKYTYIVQSDDAIGHDYAEIITASSCTQGGYSTYTCTVCGNSYTGNFTSATGHSYTNYTSDGNATCVSDGTMSAYCDNGCNTKSIVPEENTKIPHSDGNKDTLCDYCQTSIYISYTYLQYPDAALATLGVDVSLQDYTYKASADFGDGKDIWATNKGTSYNSIVKSPYFTAKITGKLNGSDTVTTSEIPVYGVTTFIGETQQGALHSYSEIYIEKGAESSFEIEITGNSGYLTINNAVILPASAGENATVTNGTAKAVISGFGTHTFLFNNENQAYAYTITVREEIDEDAEIQQLRDDGYTVYVVGDTSKGDNYDSYVTNVDYAAFVDESKVAVYLRKGSVLVAPHKYDINSQTDEDGNSEGANSGIGQNRWAFINANGVTDFKVLGYGAIDLGRLDRSERRGVIIAWSNNVEIRGIKLINSPQWSFVLYRCNGVTIKDVDILGYRQNSDAFDICNSKNVVVDGCFVRTGDDGFVVKTLGGDENAITDNILIKNSYAWIGKARAFGIFGETYNHISNVTFENNVVLFHDATWNYLRIPAIGIVVEGDTDNSGTTDNPRQLSNIVFDGIEICRNDAAAMHCLIYGEVSNYNITGVQFKNISYEKTNTLDGTIALNVINSYSSTAIIETNVIVENIVCGGTRITQDNYSQYFDYNTLHYCSGVIG